MRALARGTGRNSLYSAVCGRSSTPLSRHLHCSVSSRVADWKEDGEWHKDDVPLEQFGLAQSVTPTDYHMMDRISRHRNFIRFPAHQEMGEPKLANDAWVAPDAVIAGNAEVWDHSSVWYNCIVLADQKLIRIGHHTNIQENTTITEARQELHANHDGSTIIGHFVTVGHSCVIEASTIEDRCLVGMGCVLSRDSYMESESILGAGTVLLPGTRVPSGEVWAGNPGKKIRDLTEDDLDAIRISSENYCELAKEHKHLYYLSGTQYQEAEKLGIEVGYQLEDPLSHH